MESCKFSKNNVENIAAKTINLKTKVPRYKNPIWSLNLSVFEIKKRQVQIKNEKTA